MQDLFGVWFQRALALRQYQGGEKRGKHGRDAAQSTCSKRTGEAPLQIRRPPRLDEWEKQFLTFSDRTKVYVLNGRGGTGKSMWAVSYFARHAKNPSESLKLRERMLFLTCTGTRLPDVGKYVYGRHSGIVYDEGTPEMVWNNREIFQGLAEVSTIADTHTHRSAQQVCLNGCRQVITCNDWNERLELLPDVQRQWLESFAIVAEVDYELYTAIPLYPPQ